MITINNVWRLPPVVPLRLRNKHHLQCDLGCEDDVRNNLLVASVRCLDPEAVTYSFASGLYQGLDRSSSTLFMALQPNETNKSRGCGSIMNTPPASCPTCSPCSWMWPPFRGYIARALVRRKNHNSLDPPSPFLSLGDTRGL